MPTLELTTHTLSYERRGHGPPLLLLGGSGEPMIAWEMCGLVDALIAEGWSVIWYSARGVQPSGCPPLPWTLSSMADDAVALIDHLKVDHCSAIGYSLGGFTLEELARAYPDRIDGAILMGSAGAPGGRVREGFIHAENHFARDHGQIPPHFTRLMTLMTALGGPELTDTDSINTWWELLSAQQDQWAEPHGEIGQAQVAQDWLHAGCTTNAPWPPEVPVGLVCFEHDAMFPPQEIPALARHLGHECPVRIVPGTGHAGLMSQPQPTTQALIDILEKIAQQAAAPTHERRHLS